MNTQQPKGCPKHTNPYFYEGWNAALATSNEEHEAVIAQLRAEIEQLKQQNITIATNNAHIACNQATYIGELQQQVAIKDDALKSISEIVPETKFEEFLKLVAKKSISASTSNWLERKLLEARIDEAARYAELDRGERVKELRKRLKEIDNATR